MVTPNPWTGLRELTAARIGLGRVRHSLPTRELLAFQLAHAKARDAVWVALDPFALPGPHILLKTMAQDRAIYLRRPDLGRRLAPKSVERLTRGDGEVVVILADGLSATALHRHSGPLLDALPPELRGPVYVVEQGLWRLETRLGSAPARLLRWC